MYIYQFKLVYLIFLIFLEFRMGKTPKQYRRRDGDVTPEKIDIDEELERQYSRANRAKSSEEEKKRLEKARDVRKEEREKGIL